jgi:hypothetical protein
MSKVFKVAAPVLRLQIFGLFANYAMFLWTENTKNQTNMTVDKSTAAQLRCYGYSFLNLMNLTTETRICSTPTK